VLHRKKPLLISIVFRCTMHPLDERFSCLKISYLDASENAGKITVVSLFRPKKRNSVDSKMWREIGAAFRLVGTIGDDCRCVLLRGVGKGFCGGIDMMDEHFLAGMDGDDDDDSIRRVRPCTCCNYKSHVIDLSPLVSLFRRQLHSSRRSWRCKMPSQQSRGVKCQSSLQCTDAASEPGWI